MADCKPSDKSSLASPLFRANKQSEAADFEDIGSLTSKSLTVTSGLDGSLLNDETRLSLSLFPRSSFSSSSSSLLVTKLSPASNLDFAKRTCAFQDIAGSDRSIITAFDVFTNSSSSSSKLKPKLQLPTDIPESHFFEVGSLSLSPRDLDLVNIGIVTMDFAKAILIPSLNAW
ncbi:hypothetical protein TWF192_011547 [Orbilia oligospora]|nr:hypothetical protein TWF192_011547 [Orbilia oligospora]